MRAAVEDVHHRHRQDVRALAAEVAPQRQPLLGGRGVRGGQRDAEDRVGAEPRLVRRAVELDQRAVERRAGRSRRGRRPPSAISPLTLATACVTPLPQPGARRRRAARWPRTRRSTRPRARPRARRRRSAGRPRPRRSGCRGCRGSGGRGRGRSGSLVLHRQACLGVVGELRVGSRSVQRSPSRPRAPRPPRRGAEAGRGAQRELGVDLELAGDVDGGEQHVADVVRSARRRRPRRPLAARSSSAARPRRARAALDVEARSRRRGAGPCALAAAPGRFSGTSPKMPGSRPSSPDLIASQLRSTSPRRASRPRRLDRRRTRAGGGGSASRGSGRRPARGRRRRAPRAAARGSGPGRARRRARRAASRRRRAWAASASS